MIKRVWLPTALLICGSLLAYLPAFRAEFLPFDDQEYVFLNPNVADGFSSDSVIWAFTRVSVSNWHPLTWLSHMLDAELFDLNPHGHHAMSVAWHTANTVLLFFVMRYLTGQALPSFCLAALFALHPTHVEVVGWVAQRKTLISTFFILLTIAAYATYVRRGSWRWYLLSLIVFVLSLMAKQTFVTLPALLILLDFWPLRRGLSAENMPPHPTLSPTKRGGEGTEGSAGCLDVRRGVGMKAAGIGPSRPGGEGTGVTVGGVGESFGFWWFELIRIVLRQLPDKLPFAVLGGVAALITVLAQTDAIQSLDSFPVSDRLGNVCISYCRYLAGIFWPVHLSIYYTIHLENITIPAVVGSIVIIATLSVLALLTARKWPYLLTGWFWFLISMLPVIGIVHVGSQSMADRYLYNASFGIFVAAIWLCGDLLTAANQSLISRSRIRGMIRMGAVALSLVVVVSLAVTTFCRCQRWQTVLGTFHEAIDHDPTNWLAHRVLAEAFIALRDYDKAIHHAKSALDMYEDSGFYTLQAIACRELDQQKEAAELLGRAIEMNANDALAYSLLAVVQSELGHSKESLEMLALAEEKLKLPANQVFRRIPSLVLRNCGIALLNEKRSEEAIERFEAARNWDSRDIGLIHELAQAELQANRVESAIERLEAVRVREPKNAVNFLVLGKAYKQIGKNHEAESMLRKALELEPSETLASLQLADILLHSGRVDEAERTLDDSLRDVQSQALSKDSKRWIGELNTQLGDVRLARKDLPGAIEHYRSAIANLPDKFSANNNLAWLLATEPDPAIRNPEEAVRLAEHANSLPDSHHQGGLGTLAAAYAAAGRMDEAVQTAQQALQLAEANGAAAPTVDQLRKQLELHQNGKALFESAIGSPLQ